MPSRTSLRYAVVVACLLVASGCGADRTEPGSSDIAFTRGMTQHHAQTVQLANEARVRALPTRVWAWTDAVRTQRLAELTTLERTLRRWRQPVPATGLLHTDEGQDIHFDHGIPGVLGKSQLATLGSLHGDALGRAWLRLFVRHEQGAVRLADHEVAHGSDPVSVSRARADRARHRALIRRLQRGLTSPGLSVR